MLFLRGSLYVRVIRAKGLPDTDTAFFNIARKDKTDPFVTGELGTARIFKTRFIDNDLGRRHSPSCLKILMRVPITIYWCGLTRITLKVLLVSLTN
jgi:hypothetical protein